MVQPLSIVCQVFVAIFSAFVLLRLKTCLTIFRQEAHNLTMNSYYSIRAVAEETGLTVHTIRAWERRYGVIAPVRTGTNRRVYDEADVRRLKLLHRAVELGHSISMIAVLPAEDLDRLTSPGERHDGVGSGEAAPSFLSSAMRALQSLDASSFESVLVRASLLLGVDAFLDDFVVPLLREVGQKWASSELSIAQEHLASALVRTHLERMRLSILPSRDAPKLIAATPTGHRHEIGAMLAAIMAARMDWDVTYLGPDLPAVEIAEAAARTRASAVAISLVYPLRDPATENQIRGLGSLLEKHTFLLVGGEAATSYAPTLEAIGAKICPDMGALREWLSHARTFSSVRASL